MSTSESYTNASGLRQDLLGQLKLVQESKTPLVSRAKTSVSKHRTHTWSSDRNSVPLVNASTQTALEGADFSAGTVADHTETSNWNQIIRKDFAISGTMEASDYAGISSFVAYEKQKSLKGIGLGLEVAALQGPGNVGAAATPRQMKGLLKLAADAQAIHSANQTSAIATFGSSVGEEIMLDAAEALSLKGIDVNYIYCNNKQKRDIDKWTASATKNLDAKPGVVYNRVNVYESSFGTLEVMFSPCMIANSLVLGDFDSVRVAYLRRPFSEAQGKRGDSYPVMVLLEATLELLDPIAVASIVLS